MVQRWVAFDGLRISTGFMRLIAAVKAISVPFPAFASPADRLPGDRP
jgi:hypothetical protein